MTEVLTYATEEQADSDLERTFDRNNEMIGELERRFGDLSEVSKSKADGEEFEVECVFSLRKIAGKYFCSGGIRDDFEFVITKNATTLDPRLDAYSTLEELTNGIKKTTAFGTGYEKYGINVNLVFYTVSKPERVDDEERGMIVDDISEAIKEAELDQDKKEAEAILEVFKNPVTVEGLSPSEIAEFERLYDSN